MIIGHVSVAYAARSRWTRLPLAALLVASLAPDLLRLVLEAAGVNQWSSNEYSHLLPWSALLAAGCALVTLAWRRDGAGALVIFAVVLSHIALDMVSGYKPLWEGGPSGANLQRYQQLELVVESTLMLGGWWLLRRREPRARASRVLVLASLLLLETVYLGKSLLDRPYATRCLEYPIQPCWRRRHEQPPM
jgi:membrane-bound metal-dependent hydrolase YbcI (DUF457 family)